MNPAEAGLDKWLQRREPQWQALATWLAARRGRARYEYRELVELEQAYSALATDLGLARTVYGPDAAVTRQLEALLLAASAALARTPNRLRDRVRDLFGSRIRFHIWRIRRRIAAAVLVSGLAGFAGAWLIAGNVELAALVASEAMIETVQSGGLWTDELLAVIPPSLLSFGIMTNNIVVALSAFALGAFYGLGTLYILVLNGFLLGGTFAFTARHDLEFELLRFITAHGFVELSVIWIASAAGIGLGEALARPGNRPRAEAFREAAGEGAEVLTVCVPFLVGAGLIEGYVSPNPDFDFAARLIIGVVYESVFLLTLAGLFGRREPALSKRTVIASQPARNRGPQTLRRRRNSS